MGFGKTELYEVLTILFYLELGGILILVPPVLITQIAFTFLAKFIEPQLWIRLLFGFVSIGLICLIVYFVNLQYLAHSNVVIILCYSLSIVLSSMLFKIDLKS